MSFDDFADGVALFEQDERYAFSDMPPSVYENITNPIDAQIADNLAKLSPWQREVKIYPSHSSPYKSIRSVPKPSKCTCCKEPAPRESNELSELLF